MTLVDYTVLMLKLLHTLQTHGMASQHTHKRARMHMHTQACAHAHAHTAGRLDMEVYTKNLYACCQNAKHLHMAKE